MPRQTPPPAQDRPLERPTRATRAILTTSVSEFADAVHSAIAASAEQQESAALLSLVLDAIGPSGLSSAATPHNEAVQQQVIELIRRNLRGNDVVAHPPGEELMILLPGATRDQATHVASRLCSAIRSHAFAGQGSGTGEGGRTSVTASIGVASSPHHGRHIDTVARAARQARSAVTAEGGDGAAIASPEPNKPPTRTLELGRFAGRVEEMSALRRWLDEAIAGSPRAVAVVGEPGSGRGALLRQLEPEVRLRGGSLVVARARSGTVRSPYGIWTQVLLALRRLPDAPAKSWHELMHLHPDIAGTDEERAGSKFRLLEEISEYVRLAARSRPLVLILDEMQWVDAASWDALDHLLTQLERERILIGLTIRDDPALTDIAERRRALERIDYYHELRISRLTRDEVKRWLEGAMQRQEIGRELLAYVYRHTEGNPLFIVQLVRSMLDEGFLRHNGTKWEWSPVSELRLPNGLDAVIARRLTRLDPQVHDILCNAALIGRQFELDLVVRAGDWPEEKVRAAIDEAISADILQPNYERGGRGHVFAHARISDAFVTAIPPDRLQPSHERVARAMEDQPRRAAETAAHFDAARCMTDAYKYALEAATHAESVYAYDSSREFLELAARNATTPAELAEVRVRLATLAETVGRYDEAEELCDLAIEWYDGQGDRPRALTLRRMRERARKELGQPPMVTLEALRGLDEEASNLGSDRERVEILTMLSQTYGRIGDPKEAERLAQECVQMAERVGDTALIAAALNRLAITVEHESPKRARAYFERALALFQRLGDVRGQARAHNNLGILSQLEMRADYGRESLTMAMTLARAAGMPDLAGIAALNLGVVTQKLGDYDRAKELFGEALALFAAVRNGELQLYVLYNMANLERERGEFEQGADWYQSTSSLAQRIGQGEVEIGAFAGEGLCLLALGRLDAAKVQATLVEQRMTTRQGWFQGRELVDALRVRLATTEGRIADAIAAFELARGLAEEFDVYSAAWLTAACADVLFSHYPEQIRQAVQRYADQVQSLGFADLIRKYQTLQDLHATAE